MSLVKNIGLGISILAILAIFVLVLVQHNAGRSDYPELPETQTHAQHHSPAAQFDPALALANLKTFMLANPDSMVNCHMETHMIGHRAYSELGRGAYAYIDPICGGGYLHGVIEQAFRESGIGYADTVVHDVCTDEIVESCLHGVGHGLHEVLGNINQAITACVRITSTSTDCFDGVFMDAFDRDGMTDSPIMDVETALLECANTLDVAKQSCYFYLPRVIVDRTPTDIVSLCANDAPLGWGACAQGSGVYFMKQVSGFNQETATSFCNLYNDVNMKSLCMTGVSNYSTYGSAENTKWH